MQPAALFLDSGHTALHIIIYNSASPAILNLYAPDGRLLMQQTVESMMRIPINSYSSGIYVATLQWGDYFYTQKIVL
jgi:hypothetical protein